LVTYFILVPLNGFVGSDYPYPIDLLFVPIIPLMAAVVLPSRHVLAATGFAVFDLVVVAHWAHSMDITTAKLAVYTIILLSTVTAAAIVLTAVIDKAFEEADRTRTEAQRLADELQVANSELEERVRSRTTELAEALLREQRLSSQLAELSVRDSLTGLHNRRHMDESVDQMFRFAVRSSTPLSVAIIDLDNFKRVNDQFTHFVGDRVLQTAAHLMIDCIRGADELVRMGGEEFALLMPGTTSDEAVVVCERMRIALKDYDWRAINRGIVVTASFGIATTGECEEVSDLLRTADEQLLIVKRQGKNRVLSAIAS
jgi:diguanylate cyclase (GGDEF)-like protein